MYQLGGLPIFLSVNDLQIGRGEPVQDTARVLSRYLDGIMIRTFKQSEVEALAQNGSIPIINGLTDFAHPCQVLADLMTIREFKGSLDGLKMCFIGDGNNMMNSLIVGCLKMKMEVAVACPSGYRPSAAVLDFAVSHPAFSMTTDPLEAAKGADVVITDVWASMGQEQEAQKRREAFKGYQINDEIMAAAKKDAIVQHCLPAHRGEEITAEVFEKHSKEIFEEAENRLTHRRPFWSNSSAKNNLNIITNAPFRFGERERLLFFRLFRAVFFVSDRAKNYGYNEYT
jgi:ornithine carbamoyltransferase